MKKATKVLSLLLTLVLLCTGVSMIAYAAPTPWVDHNVQVYIEGFVSKEIYHPDDPGTSLLTPIDMDRVSAELGQLGTNLGNDIKKLSPDTVYNIWYRTIFNLFGETRLEPDGVTMQSTVTVPETTLNKKSDGRFVFRYDSRLDPVDLCANLYEYLQWVYDDADAATMRDSDGYLNIEFVGSSYGAAVLLAFLNEYGHSINEPGLKIKYDSILFCVPTIVGVDLVSEIFTGKYSIDADTLDDFLGTMNLGDDINLIVDLLDKTGVLAALLDLVVEPAMQFVLRESLHDSIVDIFGTFPAFWSFVAADSFEEALNYVYDTDELRSQYAVLIEKVRYYNDNIKAKADEILLNAVRAGLDINIICKYGMPYFPLVAAGNIMGDGFVSLEKASFGATTSMHEKTLPESYTQQLHTNKNFMSSDRCIDASTCLLPENTWLIKNLGHGVKPDSYYDLINKIIYNDLDVFSDPECPQFLYHNEDTEAITALSSVTEEPIKEPSIFSLLIQFFVMLFQKFIALFKG